TNGASDVFARDLLAATTTLISVSTNGLNSGNGPSSSAAMTPDGRWIVFQSAASDLVANDSNGVADIFIRDLQTGRTLLVSVGQTNACTAPSITPDGRFVAFVTAVPLPSAAPPPPVLSEVYVQDLTQNSTIQVSAQATNFFPVTQWPIRCRNPVMSADSHFIAY